MPLTVAPRSALEVASRNRQLASELNTIEKGSDFARKMAMRAELALDRAKADMGSKLKALGGGERAMKMLASGDKDEFKMLGLARSFAENGLVDAVQGAGIELLIQAMETGIGQRKEFDWNSLWISALMGGLGASGASAKPGAIASAEKLVIENVQH